MHCYHSRENSLNLDGKDYERSLRTDSTDDEYGDYHSEHLDDDNLNPRNEVRKYSEGTDPLKYKTEMCKNFSEKGQCNYYDKCQFAHGWHELAMPTESLYRMTRKSYRSRRCKNFWTTGKCMYGIRCQFGHYKVSGYTKNMLKIHLAALENKEPDQIVSCGSRLITGLYKGMTGLYNHAQDE